MARQTKADILALKRAQDRWPGLARKVKRGETKDGRRTYTVLGRFTVFEDPARTPQKGEPVIGQVSVQL